MSSAVGSRPATSPMNAICERDRRPKTAANSSSSAASCHGGSASSTSWPSDASSSRGVAHGRAQHRVDLRVGDRRQRRHRDAQLPGLARGRRRRTARRAAAPTSRRRARSRRARRAAPRSRRRCASARRRCRARSRPSSGASEMRPRCGLRPTRPQQAAGMRIEPPPSLPWAIGHHAGRDRRGAPPLEPPGVRVEVPRVARGAERGAPR